MSPEIDQHARPAPVHPLVERAAAYAWRLLVIAGLLVAVVWLTGQLLVVVVPVAVALLLTRALSPVASLLRRRGLRPGLAAIVCLLGFLVVLTGVLALVGANVASEFSELGPTLSDGIDDVEDWLVEDSPFDVDRADIARLREQAGEALSRFIESSDGTTVTSGARLAAEVVVGAVLALVVTFFFVKDGRRMTGGFLRSLSEDRRPRVNRMARRGWDALGGYLRGAAVLGLVESVIIGITLFVVGAGLVGPVIIITFIAAFVPIVGAVVAGLVAVLVALVTAGAAQALIVAAIALLVQQLDNDLLAPVVYGRALNLHPLVILLGIAAGGSLFGFIGTFFAVPFLAVLLNVIDETRRRHSDTPPALPEVDDIAPASHPPAASPPQ